MESSQTLFQAFAPDIVVRECLALHEAFRRFGFRAEDIWLLWDTAGVVVQLRTQDREFNAYIGMPLCRETEFHAAWSKAVDDWNEGPPEFRQQVWEESAGRRYFVDLALKLAAKGIRLPRFNPAPSAGDDIQKN